jgi:ABC-type glycerol-3-phosphate transport system substrate-binding protein
METLMRKTNKFGVVGAAIGLALALAACGSSGTSANSANSSKPFAGTTITYETLTATPEFDYYKTLMPQFTAKTGINVHFVELPVTSIDQTLQLQLKSKDTGMDVFSYGTEDLPGFVAAGSVAPLDTYLNDSKQTAATYNFSDVAPAVEASCQSGGKTYCVASHSGGSLLYYNTAMFKAAGITSLPQNPADLLADAKKLTTPAHAGFCVRGDKSQALYDAFQMWNWFIPYNNPRTGTYFDKNWKFLIGQEPYASAFGTFYRNILQKAAPKGIATYLVDNCLQDFQQGRVAMWQDDSGTIPSVIDPSQSKVAHSVAFWEMPCQAVNPDHCALVQPFGVWMNNASTHKGAAWQLIQFLTSPATQKGAALAKALLTPSRSSIATDPQVIAAFPPTFDQALKYILAHPDAALLPGIPEGVAIIPPIANGLSTLDTTQQSVSSVMATMTAGVNTIMKQAGYPKPFPSS